jgi:hypothetical protein
MTSSPEFLPRPTKPGETVQGNLMTGARALYTDAQPHDQANTLRSLTNLQIVLRCTRKTSATSLWLLPSSTMASACACCFGVNECRLPPTRPSSRARAKPSFVRSRIISRSNSAKLPSTWTSILPTAVAVSSLGERAKAGAGLLQPSQDDRERHSRCHQPHETAALCDLDWGLLVDSSWTFGVL